MELITNNGPKIIRKDEREYKYDSFEEVTAFEAFMESLGYLATGHYVSDAGKTVIFYIK